MSPLVRRFVLHWGEMGTRWGVNRSVAQIHGLLYLSSRPMTAEEICRELSIARSNVSTSLKELEALGLVQRVHVMGDRRDHFVALKDVYETFFAIVEARKRREIDPTLALLRELAEEAAQDRTTDPHVRQQIESMRDFVETLSTWYDDMKRLPRGTLMKILRMGSRIARFVSGRS